MSTEVLLVGSWEKNTNSECSQIYPDTIQFQESKLYYGQKSLPGSYSIWDVGTYEVIDPKQIRLSTAYDANISYQFSIVDAILTFVDPDGCEFSYHKVQ